MTSLASAYLFLLGLAAGFALLFVTACRKASPAWLRWLLMACGLAVVARYGTMALFTNPEAAKHGWGLWRLWFASSLALPLASAVAADQLVRHPAMTPKKLLTWFSPFLVAYGAVMCFGQATPTPDPVAGISPELTAVWRRMLAATHVVFALGFIGIAVMLMRKLPSPPIRLALLGLCVGVFALAADGVLLAVGGWYFRPYLYSEMLMLLALWHAFETGTV